MGKRTAPEADFITVFSLVMCVLGLKMLFGSKPVTTGSVVLLCTVSASAASAWTGGTGKWMKGCVSDVMSNYTTVGAVLEHALAAANQHLGRAIRVGDDEVEVDEL